MKLNVVVSGPYFFVFNLKNIIFSKSTTQNKIQQLPPHLYLQHAFKYSYLLSTKLNKQFIEQSQHVSIALFNCIHSQNANNLVKHAFHTITLYFDHTLNYKSLRQKQILYITFVHSKKSHVIFLTSGIKFSQNITLLWSLHLWSFYDHHWISTYVSSS